MTDIEHIVTKRDIGSDRAGNEPVAPINLDALHEAARATADPAKSFTFIDKRDIEAVVGPVDAVEPTRDGVTPAAVDGRVSVRELYRCGLPIRAIEAIKPNTAILLPIKRPGLSAGGIVEVVDENKGTLGTNCLAYLVAGVGEEVDTADEHPAAWCAIKPGDIVVPRNQMLEPLHPDLEPLLIHRMHILSVVRLRDDLVGGA